MFVPFTVKKSEQIGNGVNAFFFFTFLYRWDHSQEWDVARFSTSASGSDYEVKVDLESEEFRFVEGHTIDGRIILPATGYMVR